MLRIHTYFLIIIKILTIPNSVYCNENAHYDNLQLGLLFSAGTTYHFTNTNRILSTPTCCSESLSGNGSNYAYGISVGYDISRSLTAQFELQAKHYAVDLTASETTIINFEDKPENAVINHIASMNLFMLSPKLAITMSIINDFYLAAGFGVLFDIDSRTEQYELLVEPLDRGTFPDTGTRRRNNYSGKVEQISSFVPYIELGLGKQFPLNMSNSANLDLSANLAYSFIELINDSDWKTFSLNLKLIIYFSL